MQCDEIARNKNTKNICNHQVKSISAITIKNSGWLVHVQEMQIASFFHSKLIWNNKKEIIRCAIRIESNKIKHAVVVSACARNKNIRDIS